MTDQLGPLPELKKHGGKSGTLAKLTATTHIDHLQPPRNLRRCRVVVAGSLIEV